MNEHEDYVLSSILQDNTVFYDISLTPEDFTTNDTKQTFRTISALMSEHGQCDFKQVYETILAKGESVSAVWISQLSQVAPSPGNAGYYADKVRDASIRRRLRVLGLNLSEKVKDLSTTGEELLSSAEKDMLSINETTGIDYINAKELIHSAIERLEERFNMQGDYTGIPCGLAEIDRMLNGFQRQEMIVIGARASIGKTALGLTIAANAAEDVPTAFFSLEMSNTALIDRLLSMYGRIASNKIRRGNLTEGDFRRVVDAGEYISKSKLFLYDKPSARILDIRQKARRLKQRQKIELLVIDYVGLIKPDDLSLPRNLQVSQASKAIKELSRELDIPVILLAQLNRLSEGKKPNLSELKESGALEEDADVVMLLHRDREDESPIQETDCIIAKNRNGQTGSFKLGFNKVYTKFVNLAGGNE